MMELQRGQKISVQTVCRSWTLEVELRHEGPLTVDVSCFGLDGAGRLSDERYFLFYNQRRTPDGAMVLAEGPSAGTARFQIDLAALPDQIQHFSLDLLQVKFRFFLIINSKAMTDIRPMILRSWNILHTISEKILRAVGHFPVNQRAESDLCDIIRQRPEKRRSGNNDLLSDPDEKIRIALQRRIQDLKMLHDHSFMLGSHMKDCLRDLFQRHIFPGSPNVNMKGFGSIKPHLF